MAKRLPAPVFRAWFQGAWLFLKCLVFSVLVEVLPERSPTSASGWDRKQAGVGIHPARTGSQKNFSCWDLAVFPKNVQVWFFRQPGFGALHRWDSTQSSWGWCWHLQMRYGSSQKGRRVNSLMGENIWNFNAGKQFCNILVYIKTARIAWVY